MMSRFPKAKELAEQLTQAATLISLAEGRYEENDRLRTGLANIAAYAAALQPRLNGMSLKIGDVDMSIFLAALRDYAREVRDGTQVPGRTRSHMTSDTSAAARWGVDFAAPPPSR